MRSGESKPNDARGPRREWHLWAACGVLVLTIFISHFRNDAAGSYDGADGPFSAMPYRGHTIKLARTYNDFDDYKKAGANIDPSQLALVQKLVAEAPADHVYHSMNDYVIGGMDWTFPGYGSTPLPDVPPQTDGSRLSMTAYEIPRARRDRFLVFRFEGQTYTLLDDFVAGNDKQIKTLRLDGGQLAYYTGQDALVFKHAMMTDRK